METTVISQIIIKTYIFYNIIIMQCWVQVILVCILVIYFIIVKTFKFLFQ